MRWRLERTLFWITVGLVSIALLLAVAGEESSSPTVRTKILQWHEWIGLLSLPSLTAALTARWFDRHHHLLALPHWLPWLRRGLEISLYILLLLQPLSGWLLASDQGKLTSIFSWTLPPLLRRTATSLIMDMCIMVLVASSSCSSLQLAFA